MKLTMPVRADSMAQMSRVQRELLELRGKGAVNNQKGKFKDFDTPLTTPEEAEAFLATMRGKSKVNHIPRKPPSHLTADGIDDWFMRQRKHDLEMKRRRKEAEALLRGYRATYENHGMQKGGARVPGTTTGAAIALDAIADPDSHDDENRNDTPEEMRREIGKIKITEKPMNSEIDGARRVVGKLNIEDSPVTEESHIRSPGSTNFDTSKAPVELPISEDQDGTAANAVVEDVNREDKFIGVTLKVDPPPSSEAEVGDEDAACVDKSQVMTTPTNISFKKFKPQIATTMPTPAKSLVPDESEWREFVEPDPNARFPAETGRYHMFASYACPGSHRALIVRSLKGLQDVVGVTIVHPVWRLTKQGTDEEQRGWVFGDPAGDSFANTAGRGGPFPSCYEGNEPNPFFESYSVRDIYEKAGDTAGKYTVPLLWDTKEQTIVNNESSDIAYMLNSSFNEFAKKPDIDLYTEEDPDVLSDVIEWLSPLMIHGVYRCGFAKRQEAYDRAIEELTDAFDRADLVLQNSRYLTGNTLTDADIRLFVTLLRFDEVYAFYFRANTRLVCLTPSLLNYCRDIYQMEGVPETCSMEQIKAHFFASHAEWNKFSIIPKGLGFMRLLNQPHGRDHLSAEAD